MPVIRQVRDQVCGLGASYYPDWDATRLILFSYIGRSFALFFCTSDEFFFLKSDEFFILISDEGFSLF